MLYSPLSVRRSETRLPLCCSRLLTSKVLFEGFTLDIARLGSSKLGASRSAKQILGVKIWLARKVTVE